MNNENYICEEAFEELVNGLEFIESFTLYGRKSLKYHIKRLQEENQQLKEHLKQKEDIINKAKEYNNQIIKDTKEFYRPTSDLIYSGDCLIDLAEQNIKILDDKGE